MRFYPSHLKQVPYEPSKADFEIIEVDERRGQGVRVLRSFQRGDVLFRMNGTVTRELTLFTLQLGPNAHLDDPYFAGKVLHSCQPNSWFDPSSWLFFAERDIAAGDLLTMDYEDTEDVLFRPFQCQCGSFACRGRIAGRKLAVPSVSEAAM